MLKREKKFNYPTNKNNMKSMIFSILTAMVLSLSCSKNGSGTNVDVTPTISISSVSLSEGNTGFTVFPFKVTLSKATSNIVTVNFKTSDATAIAGKDYVAQNGTVTIPANTTEGVININVIADTIRSLDKTFLITLSSPQNAILGTDVNTGTILNDDNYVAVSDAGYSTPKTYPGYTLNYADEFTGKDLDANVWGYDTGGNGWGNAELENYTARNQNSFISSPGYLVIEARQESFGGNNYTSARILSQNKKTFTFGRIDIRAKIPTSKGMWPALWMLGDNITTNGWPNCGEIDIEEVIGKLPNTLYGTMHWGPKGATGSTSSGNNYVLKSGTYEDQFHVYSIVWQQDSIKWYVDDILYHSTTSNDVKNSNYPFNSPFFFIFNLAVGGNWPGPPDASTTFPQRMFIDYVRVFKKN